MDRDNRLTQIKETDLTESRLNEEFITWLKTKGLNWLLLVLVVLLGWMGWNIWEQRQAEARDTAWIELTAASLPVSYEEVASRHAGIDSVAALAQLSAGDRYLASIQSGVRFDRTPDQEDARLDETTRGEFLDAADAAYRDALESLDAAGPDPGGKFAPLRVSAWFGRAAIAESRGDLANAEAFLKQGRDAAGDRYPKVVAWADRRIEGLPALAETLPIPSQDDLPAPESLTPLSTPIADDLLQDLLSTPDPATTGTDGDAPSASDLFPPASSEDDG
ncbi:MAG: hypothetical protein ACO3YY_12695 [Phycisphaerales bacterium]|jgi:hypothetical protein|nr:hypothetical protein [Planctomycetota bacterium]